MEQGHVEVDLGFAVWRVKRAALGGMLIEVEGYVEGVFNGCGRGFDVHDHAVGGGVHHRHSIRLLEMENRRVVCFRGTKSIGKLLDAEVLVITGTLPIVELLQEIIEFGLIAQGQRDGEAYALRAGNVTDQRRDSAGPRPRERGWSWWGVAPLGQRLQGKRRSSTVLQ